MVNLSRLQLPQLLLLTAHRLLHQPSWLNLLINQANPLYLIHLVCLVDVAHRLVSFNQMSKMRQIDQTTTY